MINAFAHNTWVTGDSPMFTAYNDRIEITSLGHLPPNQTKEGFFSGVSIPVNQKLSEILLQLHISEKSGRGVPKIIEAYGRAAALPLYKHLITGQKLNLHPLRLTIPFLQQSLSLPDNRSVFPVPDIFRKWLRPIMRERKIDQAVRQDLMNAVLLWRTGCRKDS